MKNTIILAALLGLLAVSAFLLSARAMANAESLIGYGTVLALVGVAALEYRLGPKRVFGRA
jgi:hypothetical protein